MIIIRRWKFYFETNDKNFYYPDSEYEFVGSMLDAVKQANKYLMELEDRFTINRVTYESQGFATVEPHFETDFDPTAVHRAVDSYCREKLKAWKEFCEKQNT